MCDVCIRVHEIPNYKSLDGFEFSHAHLIEFNRERTARHRNETLNLAILHAELSIRDISLDFHPYGASESAFQYRLKRNFSAIFPNGIPSSTPSTTWNGNWNWIIMLSQSISECIEAPEMSQWTAHRTRAHRKFERMKSVFINWCEMRDHYYKCDTKINYFFYWVIKQKQKQPKKGTEKKYNRSWLSWWFELMRTFIYVLWLWWRHPISASNLLPDDVLRCRI